MNKLKKNYQIELCKKCWEINFSKDQKECCFFDKKIVPYPFTKLTAKKADLKNKYSKEPLINYEKNTCRFFASTESMKNASFQPSIDEKNSDKLKSWRRFCEKTRTP